MYVSWVLNVCMHQLKCILALQTFASSLSETTIDYLVHVFP